MTMHLNERLNECVRNLNDDKLIALLSGADVVALDQFVQRERSYIAPKNKDRLQEWKG